MAGSLLKAVDPAPTKKRGPAYQYEGVWQNEMEAIQTNLQAHWEFRYNTVRDRVEWRDKGTFQPWTPITEYDLNSMYLDIIRPPEDSSLPLVPKATVAKIERILSSDRVDKVHPVRNYLQQRLEAPPPKGDPIAELAATVRIMPLEGLDMQTVWTTYLKKWLTAAVANAMLDHGCQNHTCLVLTGAQGIYKSTWLDHLCPPSLKEYLYTGKIHPNNKDSLTVLSEFLLANIDDQLRQLNKSDANDLKGMITMPFVKYRRPYGKFIQEYPRLASLMGSVNEPQMLYDETGSRRWLIIEVTHIDMEQARRLDLDRCWAQAAHLWKQGFQYWVSLEESVALDRMNEQFRVISREEDLLLQYYSPSRSTVGALVENLPSAAILAELQQKSGLHNLSERKLQSALNKHGFLKHQLYVKEDNGTINRPRVYALVPRSAMVPEIPY